MTETNRIEFKRELNDDLDLEKEVVAFLNNKEGGIIYIGIDKTGVPVGVDDIDGTMLKIKDRIRNNVLPSPMGLFDVMVETIDNVKTIRIFIASGTEKPYYKAKYGMSTRGCYIRVGTAAEPMTTAQIEDLFSRRVHNSIRNIVSPRQDLTFNQLRIYYEEKGLRLNENYQRTLELLTDDGKFNYVAYLLADQNGNSMKLAIYSTQDRYTLVSNNEYGYTCLLTATQKVLDKLDVENRVHTVITPTGRHDTPQWDRLAIREAVINAIVHNNYAYGAPAKVELFSDHLEITSIGSIPDGLSKDDFFNGVSMPRNKELMRVFRDVEMVEALGSGMLRIMHTYGRENFEFGDNFIRFRVPYEVNVDIIENDTKNDTKNKSLIDAQLTERQIKIIERLIAVGEKSALGDDTQNATKNATKNVLENAMSLSRYFKVNISTIKRDLATLQRLGYLRHVGPSNGGYWQVLKHWDK